MIGGSRSRIQWMLTVERTFMTRTILVAILLTFSFSLMAQVPTLDPRSPNDKPAPLVTFEFTLAGSSPPHYGLTVEVGGRAAYRSDDTVPATSGEESGAPYMTKFVISGGTADRIFDLAKSLNYLKGDFEFHGGRIANMGSKTLGFRNGETNNSTTYNYTQNQTLQQLTSLLQSISNTLEYGRKLQRLYRYEKLGLDAELKNMEEDAKRSYLGELQLDEPILKQIAGDASVMNITRRRAEGILQKIPSESAESGKR
jgi:hypothetical protein